MDDDNLVEVTDLIGPSADQGLVAPLDALDGRKRADYTDVNGREWVAVSVDRNTLDRKVTVKPKQGRKGAVYTVDRNELRRYVG